MPSTDFKIGEYLFISNRAEDPNDVGDLTEQEFNRIKSEFEK